MHHEYVARFALVDERKNRRDTGEAAVPIKLAVGSLEYLHLPGPHIGGAQKQLYHWLSAPLKAAGKSMRLWPFGLILRDGSSRRYAT
jgi:hypothetical protein